MTNRIALILALMIVIALLGDWIANGGTTSLFLFQKFTRLVDWAAFWR